MRLLHLHPVFSWFTLFFITTIILPSFIAARPLPNRTEDVLLSSNGAGFKPSLAAIPGQKRRRALSGSGNPPKVKRNTLVARGTLGELLEPLIENLPSFRSTEPVTDVNPATTTRSATELTPATAPRSASGITPASTPGTATDAPIGTLVAQHQAEIVELEPAAVAQSFKPLSVDVAVEKAVLEQAPRDSAVADGIATSYGGRVPQFRLHSAQRSLLDRFSSLIVTKERVYRAASDKLAGFFRRARRARRLVVDRAGRLWLTVETKGKAALLYLPTKIKATFNKTPTSADQVRTTYTLKELFAQEDAGTLKYPPPTGQAQGSRSTTAPNSPSEASSANGWSSGSGEGSPSLSLSPDHDFLSRAAPGMGWDSFKLPSSPGSVGEGTSGTGSRSPVAGSFPIPGFPHRLPNSSPIRLPARAKDGSFIIKHRPLSPIAENEQPALGPTSFVMDESRPVAGGAQAVPTTNFINNRPQGFFTDRLGLLWRFIKINARTYFTPTNMRANLNRVPTAAEQAQNRATLSKLSSQKAPVRLALPSSSSGTTATPPTRFETGEPSYLKPISGGQSPSSPSSPEVQAVMHDWQEHVRERHRDNLEEIKRLHDAEAKRLN